MGVALDECVVLFSRESPECECELVNVGLRSRVVLRDFDALSDIEGSVDRENVVDFATESVQLLD